MTLSLPLLLGLRSLSVLRVTCNKHTLLAVNSSIKCYKPIYNPRCASLWREFSTSPILDKHTSKSSVVIPAYVNEKIRLLDVNNVFIEEIVYWRAKQKANKDGMKLLDLGKPESGEELGKSPDDDSPANLRSYKLASNEEFFELLEAKPKSLSAKEIVLKTRIDDNDLAIKINNARKKLNRGISVKFYILPSPREDEAVTRRSLKELVNKITKEFAGEHTVIPLPASEKKVNYGVHIHSHSTLLEAVVEVTLENGVITPECGGFDDRVRRIERVNILGVVGTVNMRTELALEGQTDEKTDTGNYILHHSSMAGA